ncbi:MAG: glycosyl transferase, group 1 [uncultured bacterium]|nr:MAG: glycosyl transferase, group 1 [uncultured bacterium]
MIIGVDITMLVYAGSGVANYIYNFAKTLLTIDKKNEYRLFYSSLRRPKNFYYLKELEKLGGKVCSYRFPPTLLQIWWRRFSIVPVEWFIGKVDVFFSSDFLRPPLFKGTKEITTIHDLTWKLFPEYHEERIIKAHEKKLEKTIKYRDTIIVDSQSTKNDLIKFYPQVEQNKVHVIYPGIGNEFRKINNKVKTKITLKKYDIVFPSPQSLVPSPYLLYVGAIEPRKNLVRSIEVFNELIKDDKFSDFKFIIAGRAGWKKESVFQRVKELNLEDKVIFTGFVEDEDLPYLYSAASLTVYLSSYEGFGLPPLESLACGTKVIAGDNSSLKETIDKEFLVDVNDKNKILEKMKYLLGNKIEINSKEVQNRFDWKESAKKFLNIITD